jgi:hypothetical protein
MGMPFNDTTNKTGLIQDCEFWTNLGDGTITGDDTLLARFTSLINSGFDEVMPILFATDAHWQWDDSNFTDYPVATTDIIAGQADYSFVQDEDGNSILEIYEVYATDPNGLFQKLTPVDASTDRRAKAIFAQNSSNVGTPRRYDKFATSIFLDPVPNYDATAGIRVVFNRTGAYFTSDDTDKTPGIPALFHRLLSLYASRDWLSVNKSENTELLALVSAAITKKEAQLTAHMANRSRDEVSIIRPRVESSR